MHISEQVAEVLRADGWHVSAPDEIEYSKLIAGFAPAGTVSNGDRIVTLTICPAGRYLARVDGWGKVQRDVDLRNYAGNPEGAIQAVLNRH